MRKVKILRAPRFDVSKLMEVHGDYTEEVWFTMTANMRSSFGMQSQFVGILHASVVSQCEASLTFQL